MSWKWECSPEAKMYFYLYILLCKKLKKNLEIL